MEGDKTVPRYINKNIHINSGNLLRSYSSLLFKAIKQL